VTSLGHGDAATATATEDAMRGGAWCSRLRSHASNRSGERVPRRRRGGEARAGSARSLPRASVRGHGPRPSRSWPLRRASNQSTVATSRSRSSRWRREGEGAPG
jgi:hypothetical protein